VAWCCHEENLSFTPAHVRVHAHNPFSPTLVLTLACPQTHTTPFHPHLCSRLHVHKLFASSPALLDRSASNQVLTTILKQTLLHYRSVLSPSLSLQACRCVLACPHLQVGGKNIDHSSVLVPWGSSDIFFPTGEHQFLRACMYVQVS